MEAETKQSWLVKYGWLLKLIGYLAGIGAGTFGGVKMQESGMLSERPQPGYFEQQLYSSFDHRIAAQDQAINRIQEEIKNKFEIINEKLTRIIVEMQIRKTAQHLGDEKKLSEGG